MSKETDVAILGAGGAGMMCAIEAARRGRRTLVLDHAKKPGGKILISGGGRCNFTNLGASPRQYVSENPHFVKSALSRYPSARFIEKVEAHGIPYHEKKLGQLFCDRSAQDIVSLLRSECEEALVEFWLETRIDRARKREGAPQEAPAFTIQTSRGEVTCSSLVVATGGLSLPKIGATGLGYDLARQFGLSVTELAPALDGFTLERLGELAARPGDLAGVSVDCVLATRNGMTFRENVLFTHSGLSGPAALQGSLHWYPGEPITLDLLPEKNAFQWFLEKKRTGSRMIVRNLLSELLPSRLAELLSDGMFPTSQPLPQVSERALEELCQRLHAWVLQPTGTVGYSKAEVTRGGVSTEELSSKTLESKKHPGLYFIGEVVDVTGWLGGYNYQWAWASGWAAGQVV